MTGLASINYNATEALKPPERIDLIRGDRFGLWIPAHGDALRTAGEAFLTEAFHAFGALNASNRVSRITRLEACAGGSTGSKFFLSVEYDQPDETLHTELFVKLSRDFDDARRDRGRYEMQPEVAFAKLSRHPKFPIRVPAGYFADFHAETGTGVMITERVRYGEEGIEPHRRKAMDYETLEDPLPHYRALVTSLARLAGAYKSGQLSPEADAMFPFDPKTGSADAIRYSDDEYLAALEYCVHFALRCPRLLPAELCTPEFLEQMIRDGLRIRAHEADLQRFLQQDSRMIALCHWNAHIDNAFFWRDEGNGLHCGLIDWGRVGRLTLGTTLWGALSAAEACVWNDHLDELLATFVGAYQEYGGPAITIAELKNHLVTHIALIGMSRVLAMPEYVTFRQPACAEAAHPHDPLIARVDQARNCLRMYTNFLDVWRRFDFSRTIERVLDYQHSHGS